MRLTAALALASLIALAFAGCSDKGGDGGESSTTSSSASQTSSTTSSTSRSSTGTTTSSTSTTGPANRAPSGSISATVNGTQATFNLTGSDPDGEPIVWDLDLGDGNSTNGTALPKTVTHAYNATGNLTVNFTITDGKSPVTYNVTLNLTGGAGAASQVYSGGFLNNNIACSGAPVPYDAVPDSQGVTYDKVDVLPATIGKSFKVVFASAAFIDHLLFVDAAGAVLADHEVGGPALSWEATGTVPAGAAAAVFYGCGVLTQPDDNVPPGGFVGESFDYSSPA